MEIKNAFEYIAGKVEAQLAPAGYTRQKVAADDKQEIVALFTSENVAYSVVYYKEKTHMVLRTCTMTEEGPDNEWKTLATWMLDEGYSSIVLTHAAEFAEEKGVPAKWIALVSAIIGAVIAFFCTTGCANTSFTLSGEQGGQISYSVDENGNLIISGKPPVVQKIKK